MSGVHLVIDAATLERERVTGHPRLLRLVIDDEPRTALRDVHIDYVLISGTGGVRLWPESEVEQGSGGDAKEAVEGEGKG